VPSSSPDFQPPLQRSLDAFRAPTRRVRIHPVEQLLVAVIALHLIFLPWALGTMHVWSQLVSLTLSVLSIGVALLPRTYDAETSSNLASFRLMTWPKLLRFPIFWLGLIFLGYVLTQALNPAFRYTLTPDQRGWFMSAIPHIGWLPTGMETPFAKANAWRSLIIYGSVWLTVCAVWIGLTRRKSLQTLLTVLAVNGVALAIFGLAQRGLGFDKIFGFWTPPANYFVASFIYKNHAGAYFNLMLTLCAGLAYWHYARGQRRLEKSTPGGLFMFFAATVTIIVLFSFSRMATFLMVGFQVVGFGYFIWRELVVAPADHRRPFATGVLVLGLGSFIALGIYTIRNENVYGRIQRLTNEDAAMSITARHQAAQATWAMVQDRPVTGWGAGSYRFYFPNYQIKFPDIFRIGSNGPRMFWEHAHNDYLELLAELGLIGTGLLVAAMSIGMVGLLRVRFWSNPASFLIFLGLLQTLAHCWVDFNFYNPAILMTWCILWPVLVRWTELEEARATA
jgi:O-antigen ligase